MKDVSRKQRVIYNSIANGIYQVILLVSGLVLPRFILLAYGSAYNGLVASLTQFLSITEVLTLGLAGAARVELYDSLACKDIKRTSGIVKAVRQYMRKAAYIYILYMCVLLLIYPHFSKGSFLFSEIASLLVIIGLGNIITYLCGYAYNVLLDADNRVYFYTLLRTLLIIVNVTISILLIQYRQSIQIVKLASGLIFAIGPFFLLGFVPKLYNLDLKVPSEKSWMKNQKYAAANSIALIIHENTDVVLLTILTSAKTISVYSVYNLVIKGLKGILSVFTSSMEPLFGDMWARNELGEMKNTLNHYEYFIGFFSSVSLSAAVGLLLPFVALYTKGVSDIEYIIPVFALMTILAELARCIRIPYLTVVQAAGKYKETQNGAFIEAGMNIAASVVLTIKFGIVGVVGGTFVANLFRTFHYSWFTSKHLLNSNIRNTIHLFAWVLSNLFINYKLFSVICLTSGLEIVSWSTWISGAVVIVFISLIEVSFSSIIFYRAELKWMVGYTVRYIQKLKGKQ